MAEVVKFYPADAGRNPDLVLEQAVGAYSDVLILGYEAETGELDVRSNTDLTAREILWMVEMFRHKLLSGDYFE